MAIGDPHTQECQQRAIGDPRAQECQQTAIGDPRAQAERRPADSLRDGALPLMPWSVRPQQNLF